MFLCLSDFEYKFVFKAPGWLNKRVFKRCKIDSPDKGWSEQRLTAARGWGGGETQTGTESTVQASRIAQTDFDKNIYHTGKLRRH